MSTILIIEDEGFIRECLTTYLSEEGYDVLGADSGEAALELAAGRPVDLFIADIRLHGMDGLVTLRQLKARCPTAQAFIFTGSLEFRITEELAAWGLDRDHVIYKPIRDLRLLLAKIQALGLYPG